jgi:hypothetical protein
MAEICRFWNMVFSVSGARRLRVRIRCARNIASRPGDFGDFPVNQGRKTKKSCALAVLTVGIIHEKAYVMRNV